MKKLFLLGLAIIVFFACQNQPQRYFEASPEIETVKAGIKAYEEQDWDTWKANFADTAKIYHNNPKGGSPDEIMAGMKHMISYFSDYKFADQGEVLEMIVDKEGKTWVNYWGMWMGKAKTTETEVTVPVHLTVEFVNGKIVQEYGYYDTSGINTAIAEIEAYNAMSPNEKAIIDAIDKVVEGWNAHDISNLKSLTSNKFIRTANGTVIANSIDEYETFMNTFVTAFPDFAVKLDKYAIKDDKVYINWTCTGTHNGDFMGNAPTGKKIMTNGFSVWSMNSDGQFTREDAFYDNLDLFNQLSITPPKA